MNRKVVTLRVINKMSQFGFEFGKTDCCLLPAAVVAAITGVNYGERFNYDSEQGANNIIEQHGGTIEALFTSLLGEPVTTGFDYGDPVLFEIRGQQTVGVWFGDDAYVRTQEGKIIPVPVRLASKGWRV